MSRQVEPQFDLLVLVRPANGRAHVVQLQFEAVKNVDDLRRFLAFTGQTVEEFKRLPVYLWNVNKPGMEWLHDL
jgi:hypothetical protein